MAERRIAGLVPEGYPRISSWHKENPRDIARGFNFSTTGYSIAHSGGFEPGFSLQAFVPRPFWEASR